MFGYSIKIKIAIPKYASASITAVFIMAYNLILLWLNSKKGSEVGGGGIRNHNPEDLKKVFEIMGYSEERIQSNFAQMLTAFNEGTPPHGGIAWGLDRLLMILLNEPNIREVMAFPKTGEGKDLLMQAPAPMPEKALKELHIEIKKK